MWFSINRGKKKRLNCLYYLGRDTLLFYPLSILFQPISKFVFFVVVLVSAKFVIIIGVSFTYLSFNFKYDCIIDNLAHRFTSRTAAGRLKSHLFFSNLKHSFPNQSKIFFVMSICNTRTSLEILSYFLCYCYLMLIQ